jgi:hypothetical protein
MEQSEEMSEQAKENLAAEVNDHLGMTTDGGENNPEASAQLDATKQGVQDQIGQSAASDEPNDPLYVQKRLKRQERSHQREMRAMQDQLNALHQQVSGSGVNPQQVQAAMQAGSQPGLSSPFTPGSDEDKIHRGVSMVLQHRDAEAKRAEQARQAQHVQQQYQSLQDQLDAGADKHADFDEVVRSPNANFTNHMRDAALLLPNAADTLYKLGKNKPELDRISQLHPLDQAKEMVKLSAALMSGNGNPISQPAKTVGQIKATPVNPQGISDKTSISELRRRLSSNWK